MTGNLAKWTNTYVFYFKCYNTVRFEPTSSQCYESSTSLYSQIGEYRAIFNIDCSHKYCQILYAFSQQLKYFVLKREYFYEPIGLAVAIRDTICSIGYRWLKNWSAYPARDTPPVFRSCRWPWWSTPPSGAKRRTRLTEGCWKNPLPPLKKDRQKLAT